MSDGVEREGASEDTEYLTVRDAARMLRVSESSLWRWLEGGELQAYRLGRKRVLLRRSDLLALIRPVERAQRRERPMEQPAVRLRRRLNREEQTAMRETLAELARLQQELLARRGGPFSDSADLIREMREERSRQLEQGS